MARSPNNLQKSTHVGGSLVELANHVRQKVFNMLLLRNILEQSVPGWYILTNFSIFFLTAAASLTGYKASDTANIDATREKSKGVIQFTTILVGYMIFNIALLMFLAARPNSNLKELFATRASIYMTISFTYVVYPLMTWIVCFWLAKWLVHNDRTSFSLTGGLFLVFVGLVTTLFNNFVITFRNDVMSRSKLSMAFIRSELIAYFGIVLSQFITYLALASGSKGWMISGSVVSLACQAYALYVLLVRRAFWDTFFNDYYVTGYATVFLSKLLVDVTPAAFSYLHWPCVILITPMVFKMVKELNQRSAKVNIFDRTTGVDQLYIGMMMCDTTLCENSDFYIPGSQQNLFVYYFSLWTSEYNLRYSCDPCSDPFTPAKFRNVLHSMFLQQLAHFSHQDRLVTKCKLLFGVVVPDNKLRFLRTSMAKAAYESGRHASESFDHYHYRKLYENKLDALYKGKIKDFSNSMPTINSIYDDLSALVDVTSDDTHSDLVFPLRQLELYKSLVVAIENEVTAEHRVLHQLGSSKSTSVQQVYRLNAYCIESRKTTMSIVSKYDIDLCSHATYCYPMLVYYFSLIRNSFKRAERIFQVYKRLIIGLGITSGAVDKDEAHLGMNCVSLLIDLEEERTGLILEATPNYFQFMGMPADKSIVGRDWNEIICTQNTDGRKKLLTDLTYQELDWFSNREVLFLGFDSFLRKCRLTLRVVPSIQQAIVAVAQLKFEAVASECVVLLDGNMNIVNAEQTFWDLFDFISPSATLKSMRQVCPDLTNCIDLCQARKDESLAAAIGSLVLADKGAAKAIRDIWAVASELLKLSQGSGLRFRVPVNSAFHHPSKCKQLCCHFEVVKLFGSELIKLAISLETRTSVIAEKSSTSARALHKAAHYVGPSEGESMASSRMHASREWSGMMVAGFNATRNLPHVLYADLMQTLGTNVKRVSTNMKTALDGLQTSHPAVYRLVQNAKLNISQTEIESQASEFKRPSASIGGQNESGAVFKPVVVASRFSKQSPAESIQGSSPPISQERIALRLTARRNSWFTRSSTNVGKGDMSTYVPFALNNSIKLTSARQVGKTTKESGQRQQIQERCAEAETRLKIKRKQRALLREEAEVSVGSSYNIERMARKVMVDLIDRRGSTGRIPTVNPVRRLVVIILKQA